MPNPLQIEFSEGERVELEQLRDRGSKAYLRERAAAILKIADGLSANQVAQQGLLKQRKCDTVCEWVERYREAGIKGLSIRQGRGRKAAFSPKAPDTTGGSGSTADGGASSTGSVWASPKSLVAANPLGDL